MQKVAVTGGIGSGKSTVCKVIESFGFPVYYADDRAKWLTNNSPQILNEIRLVFGDSVFNETGLIREALGKIVFNNADKLAQLNAIIHPVVREDYQAWLSRQSSDVVFSEIAILFETGRDKDFDSVIMVSAPQQLRIARVVQRNNLTEKEVLERMNSQLPEEEKQNKSDFVIFNNEEQSLIVQVQEVLKSLGK